MAKKQPRFSELKKSIAADAKEHKQALSAVEAERDQVREERNRIFGELATSKAKAAAADEAHDEQRKRAASEILRCAERVARIEAERDEARKVTGAAREEAAKLQGKLEALQQQTEGLMKTLASKTTAADPAIKKQAK